MMDEQTSERVSRWTIVVQYKPKMTRLDEVIWEIYRDDNENTLIDAGRGASLFDELNEVAGFLYDDAEGR